MSGPTTAIVTGNAAVVLLAAAAIRAAQEVMAAHEQAQALREQQQDQRDARQQRQREAAQQGQAAVHAAAQAAQLEFAQLQALAHRLGLADALRATQPAAPQDRSAEGVAAHVRIVQRLNQTLRSILLTEAARQAQEVLPQADFSAASAAAPTRSLSQRLLARLAHLDAVPEVLQKLALELDQCLPGERAELLASELRLQVQAHAQALQQRALQEASALVLEQSLKDLGYQVQEISHTLFVQGGVVHFRRADWGPYQVRLRAQGASVNFNVVRAVTAGDQESRVLDHLAEDRWCAEFPALLKALQARGLELQVTRRLEAGELPVQLVDASKLPTFADEEAPQARAALRTERQP